MRISGQALRLGKRLFAHFDVTLLQVPRDDVSAVVDSAHTAGSELRRRETVRNTHGIT
jgi:hypothetical protein